MTSCVRYGVTLHNEVVATVPEHFLSLTIDTSLIIGGRWWGKSRGLEQGLSRDRVEPLDLADPRLAQRASQLSPALLRVGGTEADRLHYGFDKGAPRPIGDGPFVLRKGLWKDLCLFADRNNLRLLFTLAAGPESRNGWGDWDPRDAVRLMDYTRRKDLPVAAWELGNEVNAYPFLYGWKRRVSARKYAEEFSRFAALVREHHPSALAVGPSSAIWPLVGEVHPLIPHLTRSTAAPDLGALSFHYYPQQSDRGRVAVRRAHDHTLLRPRVLNEAARVLARVVRYRNSSRQPETPIWVTETGHALYGGQSGVSDTWLSTPWWIDQLALMAHGGAEVIFRQSLVGGDYGLLDPVSLNPRPDFYASFLWKKLLGTTVFLRPEVSGSDQKLRAWCHSGKEGQRWVVLINLHRKKPAAVTFHHSIGRQFILSAWGAASSARVALNGVLLSDDFAKQWGEASLAERFGLQPQDRTRAPSSVLLPPLSVAFVEVP